MTVRAQQPEPLSAAELMARLESAMPTDLQELSAEVARFVGTWKLVDGRFPSYPPYCESLDAAVTLRPDGANCWGVDVDPRSCDAYWSRNNVSEGHWMVEASHPTSVALALCIAALKARAE